jgi:uncharacterized membrane protein
VNTKRAGPGEWLPTAGLLLLCLVPLLAGLARLVQIGTGATVTPENARFLASPVPVVIHIAGSLLFGLLGAFQFSSVLRRRHPGWHRSTGRWLMPLGFASAFSGLWMTVCYPRAEVNFDGTAVFLMRLAAGIAMAASLARAWTAIRRRDIVGHQRWATRAYALGLGAGTQVITHLPWVLWPDARGELLRSLCMGAGWVINLAVAEWAIRRPRRV